MPDELATGGRPDKAPSRHAQAGLEDGENVLLPENTTTIAVLTSRALLS